MQAFNQGTAEIGPASTASAGRPRAGAATPRPSTAWSASRGPTLTPLPSTTSASTASTPPA
jgi:hypothetical protein